jgi:hypothetical protein
MFTEMKASLPSMHQKAIFNPGWTNTSIQCHEATAGPGALPGLQFELTHAKTMCAASGKLLKWCSSQGIHAITCHFASSHLFQQFLPSAHCMRIAQSESANQKQV